MKGKFLNEIAARRREVATLLSVSFPGSRARILTCGSSASSLPRPAKSLTKNTYEREPASRRASARRTFVNLDPFTAPYDAQLLLRRQTVRLSRAVGTPPPARRLQSLTAAAAPRGSLALLTLERASPLQSELAQSASLNGPNRPWRVRSRSAIEATPYENPARPGADRAPGHPSRIGLWARRGGDQAITRQPDRSRG